MSKLKIRTVVLEIEGDDPAVIAQAFGGLLAKVLPPRATPKAQKDRKEKPLRRLNRRAPKA